MRFHLCSQSSVRTWIPELARALQYEGLMDLHELKLKQEMYALAQSLIGFVIVGLVLVGIGGTIYKVISPDGWIALAFGRSLSAGAASLGSLIMIAGLAWFSRGWSSPRYRNRFSDLLVFSFAAAGGAFFGPPDAPRKFFRADGKTAPPPCPPLFP